MGKSYGTPMHTERLAGGLFGNTLYRMAQKLPPNERDTRSPVDLNRKMDRQQAMSNKSRKNDLTDAQVVEMRRLREECGWPPKRLAELFGVPRSRVWQIIDYQTRAIGV